MLNEFAGGDWTGLGMIPLPPLVVALLLGLLRVPGRRPLPRRAASLLALAGLAASFIASVLSFSELLFNDETSALVGRVSNWLGAGVGGTALIGDLAFRFDALSSVVCLVVSGVGLLLVFYATRSLALEIPEARDYQRFLGLASFQIGVCLVFVLADNLLLMLAGFAGTGVGAYLLAGFWHGDRVQSRLGSWVLGVGRVGDVALLVAVLLIFRALDGASPPSLALEDVRSALLGLAGLAAPLPAWMGGGELAFLDALGLCLLVAALGMGAQLAFVATSPAAGPLPGLALMQTVTVIMAVGYLVVRFSFVFSAAPLATGIMTGVGACSALVAAILACRSPWIGQVLAWSSLSQLGLVLVAAGLGAQTAALFHLVGHAFFKGLLLIAAGVVIVALRGEQDMRRMGSLGSRMGLTRAGFWIGGFSLAGGLPLTVGFFSMQQIAVAAHAADPGLGNALVYPAVLLTLALTTFYIFRLIVLVLQGDPRLPPQVHWDEVEDPEPPILWSMGILAALSILGALIGFPQFWADFLFEGDIEQANSLHYFLSGVVASRSEMPLDNSQAWSVTGWTVLMTCFGGGAVLLFYSVQPGWLMGAIARLGRGRARAGRAMAALGASMSSAAAWMDRGPIKLRAGSRPRREQSRASEPEALPLSAGLLRYLADRLLKPIQSGFVQHSLALSLVGSLALVLYFLWAGRN